ncbi:HEPN domain-containing protein [Cellvibrio sp. pealriver]|uniref:HEPN domain-containing protein n=1 Tax=Cellvibrio sp. pealriver TaxID=1622269 RepID=UPI00066FD76C|nr:HEPN domain-containing protein [Cellvibrio sp. pealriver]
MYKVEYLVLFDADKTQCKTVSALKNLLQADSDISIDRNKVSFDKKAAELVVKLGKKDDKAHIYFNLMLRCNDEDDLEWFSSLLRSIRRSLSLITKSTYVVWDDLSLYYCSQAYPLIFNIENLMRQVITKFMLTNIGLGWIKDRLPTDVQQSVNMNNKDANYLYNVDFIQLKNFLFSENYPSHKENLINKFKSAKDLSELNIDEIKALIPESNWDKYFKPIVDCDAEYLKKRWDLLYDLRCKVAHNKDFTKNSLEDVKKLVSELSPFLEKAISSLDSIAVSEDEKDAVFESVLSTYDIEFSKFMARIHRLESLLDKMIEAYVPVSDYSRRQPIIMKIHTLRSHGVINEKQAHIMDMARRIRNKLVHNEFDINPIEVMHAQTMLEELIIELELVHSRYEN